MQIMSLLQYCCELYVISFYLMKLPVNLKLSDELKNAERTLMNGFTSRLF
jgi:hypothetical protein